MYPLLAVLSQWETWAICRLNHQESFGCFLESDMSLDVLGGTWND